MKTQAQFVITVDIDAGLVEQDARLRHVEPAQVLSEIVGDIECRLHDAVRWRHGVERVGCHVQQTASGQKSGVPPVDGGLRVQRGLKYLSLEKKSEDHQQPDASEDEQNEALEDAD